MSRPAQRVQFYLPVILVVLASCLRVFVCFQHNPLDYLWSDNLRHWTVGEYFPKTAYDGASDPIMYQVYMFVLRRISFDNRYVVALASALMSIVMPWTYYRAARSFGLRKLSALWLWALIAWTPSLLTIYHFLMMETLLLLLEGAALWATARYQRKGGTWAFLIMVVAWTLACLTKPTVGLLAAISVLWVCWRRIPSIGAMASGIALVIVLLIPQSIRSDLVLGFVAPFGNPWFVKIQHRSGARTIEGKFYSPANERFHKHARMEDLKSTSPSCNIRPLWPLSGWTMSRSTQHTTVAINIDATHGARDWKNAYDSLNVGWDEWFLQLRENIVLFLFSPSWPEDDLTLWDGKLEFYGRWLWAPLIIFLLVYNLRGFLRRQFELIPVVVTVFTLFLALQNAVTFEGRYRKPLEPLLLLNLVWIIANRQAAPEERLEEIAKPEKAHV